MEYQAGNSYEFNVQGLKQGPDGELYVYLDDGCVFTYRVKPYSFQLEPSYQFPNKLLCDVFGTNYRDQPLLRQNKEAILEEHYERSYDIFPRIDFSILKVGKDGSASYLLIQDEYGIPHRYYTKSAEDYEVGGSIELCVKGIISRKGKAYLELIEPRERKHFTIKDLTPYVAPDVNNQQTTFGKEDLHTEFKTSIVFSAKSSEADIDAQMLIILKEIAAFMNAEGGRMYIGVKDDGETITGIENDYPHLGESDIDRYTYDVKGKTEQQKQDIYENKIRNSLKHINSIAGSLVNISFQKIKNHTICVIDIKPSPKPMFVNGILYQRQGASCRPLQRDDISYFVLSKLQGDAMTAFLNNYGADMNVPEDDEDVAEEVNNNEASLTLVPLSTEDDDRDHTIWKQLCFYSDGSYSERKANYQNPNNAHEVHNITIEKYQKKEHQVLLMQYNGGFLNAVNCDNGPFNQRGWGCNGSYLAKDPSARLERVWCADSHDFVAVYCEKDGATYVRVVNVSDIGVHDNLYSHGNLMAPGDYNVVGIYHIPASYHPYIVQLIKRVGPGYDVDGNKKQKSIQRLNEIIKSLPHS